MLFDLSFLQTGQIWPPAKENERLLRYNQNKLLFEGFHEEVFKQSLQRLQRMEGYFGQIIQYEVMLNYPKLVSCKTADLLFGEPPAVEGSLPEGLWVTAYEVVVDVSRYGTGLFYLRNSKAGPVFDMARPSEWFPVFRGRREIECHVLASVHNERLEVEIHRPGTVEQRGYHMKGNRIGTLLWKTEQPTGLDGFAVIPVHNVTASDNPWGIDDYRDMDSLLCEMEVSLAQMSRILDRHADPSLQGPESALEWNEDAQSYELRAGRYFITQEGQRVEYLTWDAKMDACFAHFKRLLHQLYTITEMGSVIFGDWSEHSGSIPSGAALKRLLIAPLAKVNRIKLRMDPGLRAAINGWRKLMGLTPVEKIEWRDGLPDDELEMAQIEVLKSSVLTKEEKGE